MDKEIHSRVEIKTQETVKTAVSPQSPRNTTPQETESGLNVAVKGTGGAHCAIAWLEGLAQDARIGARMLWKSPGFTAVAILTLGLGIGTNTAIFSIINGLLLRPLPYREPDRLVTVCESNLKRGHPQIVVSPANLRDWRAQNSAFEELGGQINTSLTLTGVERAEHLHAAWTTENFFSVFGVAPLLGRTFVAEDRPPNHRAAVLSYGLWRRCFGTDHNIIGKAITLSGVRYTVVGVMPSSFKIYQPADIFGLPTGDVQPQLWAPYPNTMNERTNKYFLAFARLKRGVTLAQARNEISAIVDRAKQKLPSQKDWGSSVQPLNEQIVGGSRPALRLLLGAVVFVLLIACANVANLSLARSAGHRKELAIRLALGASRFRVGRQLLVESMLLALLGGGFGVMLAYWSLEGFLAFQPANFPRMDEIHLDSTVLAFTLLISLLTGLIFGLAPAIQASRPDLNNCLKDSGHGSSEGHRQRRMRDLLVVAEVALAMILLAGAGLMINSFARLTSVSPGFEPEHLLTFDVSLAGRAYAENSKRISLARQLRERLQAQVGVKSVDTVYGLPFGTMMNSLIGVTVDGRPATEVEERIGAGWRVVSPSYFDTMGVRLLMGRPFSEKLDTIDSPPVAIINEAFYRKNFSGEDAVGKRIKLFPLSTNWHEIVGVVRDIKMTGLDVPPQPDVYQSDSQNGQWMFSIVVRSSLPARKVEKMVRDGVAAIDRDLPLYNVRTMEQAITNSMASTRFLMMLIGVFAALALTLTAVGVYGVVSYSVSQQSREIGIRMALGASRRAVLGLVLRQATIVALVGSGIGLAGSLGFTRLLANQLFGVSATDPTTFVVVVVILMLVTLTASYPPARRATKVDPMVALRAE